VSPRLSSLPSLVAGLRRRKALAAGAALAALAAAGVGLSGMLLSDVERTDDAFVEGAMSMLAAQVPGRVVEVAVDQHARVRKGELLVRLDPSDYAARVARGRAELQAAWNRVAQAEAAAASASAEAKAAAIDAARAGRERERVAALFAAGAASRQQLDVAGAAHEAAQAHVRSLELRAEAERAAVGDEAPVHQAEAALAEAELALAHTELRAPFDAYVGRKNVEPGAVVQPGQALMSLARTDESWVMANFKETQVGRMHVGDRVQVTIDAFPDHVFSGHVASFSPATGAKYALIPPEPAAGNFTKVVQRVPVKITLDELPGAPALAVGLSALVEVHVD
jgi:membrane fusion protein (multidrug efflux system)